MLYESSIKTNKIIISLVVAWLTLWLANAIQDIIIWLTGTSAKIWVLDLDFEESFYTWFSTVMLSAAAFMCFFLSLKDHGQTKNVKTQWRILGSIFFLLSADEMLSFHERVSGMLSTSFTTSGMFEFAWVIPALVIIPIFLFLFLPFIRHLHTHVSYTIIIAGSIFVFGAVGMEMIAGIFISENNSQDDVFTSPMYRFLVNIEEGLEVLGVIVFIKALLMQAEIYFPEIQKGKSHSPLI